MQCHEEVLDALQSESLTAVSDWWSSLYLWKCLPHPQKTCWLGELLLPQSDLYHYVYQEATTISLLACSGVTKSGHVLVFVSC